MEQAASLGVFGALQKMTETFRGVLPIFILLSLVAGVWLYYLLVSRHEPSDRSFGEALRAFLRFEQMFWPLLGRVLYLSLSVFLVLSGLLTMIAVNFFGGLVGTTLLLLVVRILFEMTLVLFSLYERLLHLEGGTTSDRRNHREEAGERRPDAVRRKDFRMFRAVRGMSRLMSVKRKGRPPVSPDEADNPHD